MSSETKEEIRQAILYYDSRGWDWLWIVSYLSCRGTGWKFMPLHSRRLPNDR